MFSGPFRANEPLGWSGTGTTPLIANYGDWYIVTMTFDYTEGIPRVKTNDEDASGPAGPGSEIVDVVGISLSQNDAYAELLVYNWKLSDVELNQLRNYLSDKWGIPITV